ncbi:hypothetical protein BDBG_16469 [Blastomyces gilchristii SLH14081]|uniref:COPII vesicles protein Yip3 n=1 Tax=Blastomyces gilchristii (strain SLH14081) TaxID=559298 RepID=A0A179UBZ5_BLAGS|nr:uncharacterized protein BDBG_16469 [Blastomyces gilchristii SLH14081]OAT05350.1 hypothetical protein BDBG_16469 [Blastomyces gilchristii SLH14081]
MARLQIPLDALTSRLNLSDRFAGVRAQSLTSRFSNLRPISEFLDIKRVSKPANFSEVQSRVNYNLSYFSSNYAAVFIMLSIYSLLTNLILLFVILLAIGGSYGIGRLEGRDLEVAGFRATTSQLYTTLLIIWARVGRSKKEGWPEQLEESVRIEQLGIDDYDDDEDDENEGVLLGPPFDPGRFHNSNMRPMCPGTYPGVRRKGNNYDFDDDEVCGEEYSSGDDDQSEHGLVGEDPNSTMAYAMQLARRDQQAMLVERALGKIRRAQMQGQTKVMLSQRELDALEKKRQQDGKVNGSKPKDSSGQPVIENKPIASDKRIPGGYASSTGSPRFRSPTVEPSSPSSQKPRSRAPSIKSSRMSHHMDASPRNQHPPMYPQPLPYFVPQEPTVRPGSSSYQSNPRSGSSSNNHSAYPPHHHPSPYYTYPLPATDTRYGYSTHTHRSAPPPHIDATYQPIYRAMSGDSYMINHSSSDPFIVQHASRLCESPRSMRRSSGSSSSGDNGVHNISVAESPSVPVGSEKKVSSGSGSGHGRIRRRKRRH